MQTPNENPISNHDKYKIETSPTKSSKPTVHHHHHTSKQHRTYFRSAHFRSTKYADIGFTITKVNKKYVAHCKLCNRTLGNTAYSRLTGHRNICREAIPENDLDSALNSAPVNEAYDTRLPQITNDSSTMTPKLEVMDCKYNENIFPSNESSILEHHPSYSTPEQDREMLNEENQLQLNMIEVLLPIKYNKKLLFDGSTATGTHLWTRILSKAQALNLAPPGVRWTYVRDSLYSVWRLHTLQKRDAIDSGNTSIQYNIVDLLILQIENSISENDNVFGEKTTNSILTQTSDEIYKADLRLKQLQCEAMEIENYKRCLETFELERKLQVPHSKLTLKYIPLAQNESFLSQTNGELVLEGNRTIKIELDN